MDIFKRSFKKLDETLAGIQREAPVQKWLNELEDGLKREKEWRKEAQKAVDVYEQKQTAQDSSPGSLDYNILFANTETLEPAVYNNTPRPVVKRKTQKDNPVAIAAAQILRLTLTHLTDTGDARYATFDDLQKEAVREGLLPGRGLTRFSYDAYVEAEEAGAVKEETVCGEAVPWNRVVYGYAKQPHKIPWIAFEHYMTREECIDNFGEKLGAQIKLTHSGGNEDSDGDKDDGEDKAPAAAQGVKFAHIWEIWDRTTRKQIYLSEGYPKFIEENDDPLGLEGFFPCPNPIKFVKRVSSLQPKTLYSFYERQAEELDLATRRINGLLKAMKVRGFYDGTLEGLDDLLTKPENTFLPARNVAAMQQGMSLEKAIWFMPLESLISVLQQLYVARTQIINTIHQLTGIADIMRGASQASETLGAQEIKQAWGTMRLKRMQKEVQRYTRDCYRLKAEIAARHFSVETFEQMTAIRLPRMAQRQQAQMQLQGLMMQVDQLQAQAQSGMAPPNPQAGQQLQAQIQQLQQIIAIPTWEEVLQFLRSDSLRNYVIDIETNSTIDIEATEDKQELAELMNSLSQLFNGVFPMVKEGVLPFDAAKSLVIAVMQKFRIGDEVEEIFRSMKAPAPKEDPAAQKVKAEMQRDQQKFQQEQQDRQQEMAQKRELAQFELQVKREELEFKRRELQMREQVAAAKHARDMEMIALKATMPPATPAPQPDRDNDGM